MEGGPITGGRSVWSIRHLSHKAAILRSSYSGPCFESSRIELHNVAFAICFKSERDAVYSTGQSSIIAVYKHKNSFH